MMRRIPLVMLCLLLCGCGQQPFPEAPEPSLPRQRKSEVFRKLPGEKLKKRP